MRKCVGAAAAAAVSAATHGGTVSTGAWGRCCHLTQLQRASSALPPTFGHTSTTGSSTRAGFSTSAQARAASGQQPPNAMALIRELRQQTGAPIADVKSSLAASGWDVAAAMEALRLKGLAAAVKKASRRASEGLVAVAQQGPHTASVVEVNSETDFVGRSPPFQQLVLAAARAALGLAAAQPQQLQQQQQQQQPAAAAATGGGGAAVQQLDPQQLSGAPLGDGSSIGEGCANLAGTVRENIALRRGWLVSSSPSGAVGSYVHMPVARGAGRIAAVVVLEAAGAPALQQDTAQQLSELAAQLAMHSAGMDTRHVSADDVPCDVLAGVRSDFASQTQALLGGQGKPEAVLAKVVDGKVAKWLKESCLLDQRCVMDDAVTVRQLLASKAQQMGLPGPLRVSGLLRAQVGEGLAKADDSPGFAAEVAAMAARGA